MELLTLSLVITFLTELLGAYFSKQKIPNFRLYYFYTGFEYVILFFLYKNLLKEKKYLKIPYLLLVFFIAFWLLTFFNNKYFYYTIIIGSFNVAILVFLYLRELLLSNEILNYKKLLPFWVSIGLLVFHLPSIPFFSFIDYMTDRDLFPILYSLIVLMNIFIAFGLVWTNRKVKCK